LADIAAVLIPVRPFILFISIPRQALATPQRVARTDNANLPKRLRYHPASGPGLTRGSQKINLALPVRALRPPCLRPPKD